MVTYFALKTKAKITKKRNLVQNYRRLGGESDREISMAPACVILSLGLWSSISPPGSGVLGRALGVAFLVGIPFPFVSSCKPVVHACQSLSRVN